MSDTYLNGEVTALKQARAKAQETINRLDRALAILDGAEAAGASPLLVSGAVLPDRKGRAVAEYREGKPASKVATRYGVATPTIYRWLKASGVPLHG